MKFLIYKLDFRPAKVSYLHETHGVNSVESFFNAYAPDKEGGLYNHEFILRPKEI